MENLIKQVKKLRIDKGLDYKGSQTFLAGKIKVHPNSLSMALTEFRQTPGSIKILNELLALLNSLPNAKKPKGGRNPIVKLALLSQ